MMMSRERESARGCSSLPAMRMLSMPTLSAAPGGADGRIAPVTRKCRVPAASAAAEAGQAQELALR
jgi:hypothetical protein